MSDTEDRERDGGAETTAPEQGNDFPDEVEEDFPDELDEVDVRDLLRGAMRPAQGAVAPSLLRGVQRRIRVRSKGKFYGDGWSTTRSPRSTYLVTSLLMLGLVLVIFLVLVPWSASLLP